MMKFTTSDGLELYYERSGQGIPCIFLHGGPGYWSKSFQYYAKDMLEDDLEMIYLDQRGCGRSNHSTSQAYTLERMVKDIEELRVHLNIEEWLVLGHSFGGLLTVNYAYHFPKHTKGIILSNATLYLFNSFEHQMNHGMKLLGDEKLACSRDPLKAFIGTYYEILSRLIEADEYDKLQFVNSHMKEHLNIIDQEGLESDPHFQQFIFSSPEYFQDYTSLMVKFPKPVLVIVGNVDHAVGPHHHQLFQFQKAKVKEIECGHHPYVESPEVFKKAIIDFLEEELQ